MKKWKMVLANVLSVLKLESLPQKEGKLSLSKEQKEELIEALNGDQTLFDNFEKMANAEFEQVAKLESERDETKAKLQALLKENGIDEAPKADDAKGEDSNKGGNSATPKAEGSVDEVIAQLQARLEEQQSQIEALTNLPEADNPLTIKNTNGAMKLTHSATHLFASNKSYDALENRPWNQRLKAATTPGADPNLFSASTNWDAANIARVNQDFEDYWRQDRQEVLDIMQDYRGIPSNWEVITGVDDRIGYVGILTQEITQGRKKNWLPKNKQKFIPLEGKVYPVHIDIQFEGYELQQIETSWMNRFNKEGSQPNKMSFVRMLWEHLLKQARKEDDQVIVKGVYLPDVDRTEPQSFIFRSNGFLKLVADNMYKTFNPFKNMGTPTPENIVDYVKGMCEKLPEEKRTMPGLDYGMSPTHLRWYVEKKKLLEGTYPTYKEGDMSIDGFPNIQLKKVDYLEGTNFHYITPDDNIKILENVPREKALLTIEYLKRQIFILGDYKMGAHVDVFGMQWEAGTPVDYNNQIFWCNDVELLTDVKVPIPADDTTPSAQYHNVLITSANTGATAITNIDDTEAGKYYYLYGGSDTNASTIANSGNFDLAAAITLDSNTMIKLYKRPKDSKFVEIYRNEDLSAGDFAVIAPDATTIDASASPGITKFVTSTNTQATAITDIENAEEGITYRIEGGSDNPNATTIAKSGKFSRLSAAITLTTGVWVDVIYQDGKFIEVNRS